ncbi:hypothetical protein [Actinoplanes sp. NPDC049118]
MTMHARTVLSLQQQHIENGPEGEEDVEAHAFSAFSLAVCEKPC